MRERYCLYLYSGKLMAIDTIHQRGQRLRKQAELQSFYRVLDNLRKQEVSYIKASVSIPGLLLHQINKTRHEIKGVEAELVALNDESVQTPGDRFYREGFEAELAGNVDKAIKLYKNASHYNHPDASAAIRSVRYVRKIVQNKTADKAGAWPAPINQLRSRLLSGLVVTLVLLLIGIIARSRYFLPSPATGSTEPTSSRPAVKLIISNTVIPIFTPTPTPAPSPTPTPYPTALILPTATSTSVPTLRPAPRIIEPHNNLVWLDGAVVFEFQEMDLADDELYCLNTLRGFDQTYTENWSYPPTGSKKTAIPIEANVFHVAKDSGMRCISWSAALGKGSCKNIISESTEERVIGLPAPCNFK